MSKIVDFISKILQGDRRKEEHLSASRIIDCLCTYKEANAVKDFRAEIVNVSRGGLLLMNSRLKVRHGAKLEVRFELPSAQEPIVLHGTIIRIYPEKPQKWYYTAVKFDNENEAGIQQLLSYFHSKA